MCGSRVRTEQATVYGSKEDVPAENKKDHQATLNALGWFSTHPHCIPFPLHSKPRASTSCGWLPFRLPELLRSSLQAKEGMLRSSPGPPSNTLTLGPIGQEKMGEKKVADQT